MWFADADFTGLNIIQRKVINGLYGAFKDPDFNDLCKIDKGKKGLSNWILPT